MAHAMSKTYFLFFFFFMWLSSLHVWYETGKFITSLCRPTTFFFFETGNWLPIWNEVTRTQNCQQNIYHKYIINIQPSISVAQIVIKFIFLHSGCMIWCWIWTLKLTSMKYVPIFVDGICHNAQTFLIAQQYFWWQAIFF